MTIRVRWALPIAAALAVAACAAPAAPSPPARPTSAAIATTSSSAPTTITTTSAFCQSMDAFQAGVVVYRDDVLKAAQGAEQLDVAGMRQRAANIAYLGQSLLPQAPPEIAGQLRSVLDAIATTADRLAKPATVRDIYEPLFTGPAAPAFDAVDKYNCSGG
jgi:hypothetical protein